MRKYIVLSIKNLRQLITKVEHARKDNFNGEATCGVFILDSQVIKGEEQCSIKEMM